MFEYPPRNESVIADPAGLVNAVFGVRIDAKRGDNRIVEVFVCVYDFETLKLVNERKIEEKGLGRTRIPITQTSALFNRLTIAWSLQGKRRGYI